MVSVVASLLLTGCVGLLPEPVDPVPTPVQYSAGLGGRYPKVAIPEGSAALVEPAEGQTAPEFLLRYSDGTEVSSVTLRGQPVLINFWATWCAPCRREMPALVTEFETNEDLLIIAVNQLETLPRIQPFVEEFQMSMIVAIDSSGEMRKIYGVEGLPTTVFIDREGKIAAIWSGYLADELLEELLAEIL